MLAGVMVQKLLPRNHRTVGSRERMFGCQTMKLNRVLRAIEAAEVAHLTAILRTMQLQNSVLADSKVHIGHGPQIERRVSADADTHLEADTVPVANVDLMASMASTGEVARGPAAAPHI